MYVIACIFLFKLFCPNIKKFLSDFTKHILWALSSHFCVAYTQTGWKDIVIEWLAIYANYANLEFKKSTNSSDHPCGICGLMFQQFPHSQCSHIQFGEKKQENLSSFSPERTKTTILKYSANEFYSKNKHVSSIMLNKTVW